VQSSCRFCDPHVATSEANRPWAQPIAPAEHFHVLPSKGALVPGWVLIVPKDHKLSLSELTCAEQTEIDALVFRISDRMLGSFGPVTMFEHGATCPGSTFGCGLDHAHLHLTALPFDLTDAVRMRTENWFWNPSLAPWCVGPQRDPYLAMTNRHGEWLKCHPDAVPKQFFRSIIAEQLGMAAEYDYDLYPRFENVSRCLAVLG
jgi:diadenosine tetraphosphate (Ap4A) HIT family hydrolase